MKLPKALVAENRERILEAAMRLFKQNGFDGVGVAELMKHAGLTHGGFYGHFDSKEALAAECCTQAMAGMVRKWRRAQQNAANVSAAVMMGRYLTRHHRDDPGSGCPLPALAVDVARQHGIVRAAFTDGLRPFIDVLAQCQPGSQAAGQRQQALAILSSLVGAIVLARAVDDDALSTEILSATALALGVDEAVPPQPAAAAVPVAGRA